MWFTWGRWVRRLFPVGPPQRKRASYLPLKLKSLERVVCLCALVVAVCLLRGSGVGRADEFDYEERLKPIQEKVLRDAGIPVDDAGLLAFIRAAEPPAEPQDIPRLIRKLGGEQFAERTEAAALLVRLGPKAVADLRRASTDPDPEVARRARDCLERIEKQEFVPGALNLLVLRKTVEPLRALLRSTESSVRATAAQGLGKCGTKAATAVPQLLEMLSDPVAEVRAASCSALLRLVGPDSLPAVLRLVKDRRRDVRLSAIYLLRRFSKQSEEVVPVLLEALRDQDIEMRAEAASSLARFGSDTRVALALCEALKDRAHAERQGGASVAQMAIRSLGDLGPAAEPALPALIEVARGSSLELRQTAVRALGDIGAKAEGLRPKLVLVFIAFLKEKDVELRTEAAFALGKMGPGAKEAVPALRETLQVRDVGDSKLARHIRLNILWTLEQMGPAAANAVPELIAVLDNASLSNEEHRSAATVLGKIGPQAKTAVPALTRATKDEEYAVRKAAQDALQLIQR
jgi:HEAT repeat protein